MENKISEFFLNETVNLDTNLFIINLAITSLLCYLIRIFYLKFSSSLSNRDYFSKNFIILGITTCIVITIVKSSLALSLGLVGALSIVRFRAAIKEPEELVYLFLVIATGLGLGANQTKITILGVLTTLVITFLFSYFKKEKIEKIEYETFQLSISRNKSISEQIYHKIIPILVKNFNEVTFISISNSKNHFNINFEVLVNSKKSISKTISQLNNISIDFSVVCSKKDNISL
jgi:hypothetical protein